MINAERVKQARELCGLTQEELAERIQHDQSLIAQIESGNKQPSDNVLVAIAMATGFPPAFFKKAESPDLPIGSLLFRAHARLSRQERIQAYRYAQILYEVAAYMANRVKAIPVRVPELKPDPTHAARVTRSELGLSPDRPIGNLINALEKGGVLILALPILLEGRDAFSSWVGTDQSIPVIFLSGGKTGDRLRFNIAHELAHLVMHRGRRDEGKELESQAHQFSSEFLMPEEGMRTDLVPPITLTSLAPLKQKWGVSIQALVKRAKDLEIISPRQYRYLFEQIGSRGWRLQEPLNLSVPVEKPRAFKKMAELIYNRPIEIKRFSDDVKLTPSFIRELLDAHADMGPPSNERIKATSKVLSFSKS